MDQKTFNRKIAAFKTSAKRQRDTVQELIVAGLAHLADHDDSTYLTQLVHACKDVRSVPTRTITGYIQEHAPVKWGTLKNKTKGYKKSGKGAVKMPEVVWYEWEGGKHNEVAPNYEFTASIKRAVTTAVQAYKDKRITKEQWEAAVATAKLHGIEISMEA